jgi:autotransporter-associated beta strand protein
LRFKDPAGSTLVLSNGVVLSLSGQNGAVQTLNAGILMTANSGPVSITGPGYINNNINAVTFIHQYSANPLVLAAKLNSGSGGMLLKCGSGELILTATNNHARTYIMGGTLTVDNITNASTACAIGTDATLYIANATFKYVGAAKSHDRLILLRGPATIDASGAGLLEFTRGTNITVDLNLGADNSLTLTGTGTGQMDGSLDLHMGGIIKTGSGTWTIGGTQPYTGDTIVSNGTLRLSNNCVLARSVRVASGGTLAGSATIREDLVMNGARRLEIRGDGDYDTLNVGYDTTLGGTLNLVEMNGYKMPANVNMTIVSTGGTVSGAFTTVTGGFTVTPSADGKQLLLSKRYPGFIFYVL